MILGEEQFVFFSDSSFFKFIKERKIQEIAVDIGCGHGHFMVENCGRNRNVLWIGIEISMQRARRTLKKLEICKFTNFLIICADAQDFLMHIPSEIFDKVHINFPDPWIKSRHWKNRLFRPSFMIDLLRTLKVGATVSFVTDIRDYAEASAQLFLQCPFFENVQDQIIQENIYNSFPTLFYERMHKLRKVSYILFKKNQDFKIVS